MFSALTLLLTLATTSFESTIDRTFSSIQNSEWPTAAAALDQGYADDPALFAANNFHYLRGASPKTLVTGSARETNIVSFKAIIRFMPLLSGVLRGRRQNCAMTPAPWKHYRFCRETFLPT